MRTHIEQQRPRRVIACGTAVARATVIVGMLFTSQVGEITLLIAPAEEAAPVGAAREIAPAAATAAARSAAKVAEAATAEAAQREAKAAEAAAAAAAHGAKAAAETVAVRGVKVAAVSLRRTLTR